MPQELDLWGRTKTEGKIELGVMYEQRNFLRLSLGVLPATARPSRLRVVGNGSNLTG